MTGNASSCDRATHTHKCSCVCVYAYAHTPNQSDLAHCAGGRAATMHPLVRERNHIGVCSPAAHQCADHRICMPQRHSPALRGGATVWLAAMSSDACHHVAVGLLARGSVRVLWSKPCNYRQRWWLAGAD